jgi:hypothetical protein
MRSTRFLQGLLLGLITFCLAALNITPDGKFVGDAAESWQMSPDGLLHHAEFEMHWDTVWLEK